jgi:hypothetical protein
MFKQSPIFIIFAFLIAICIPACSNSEITETAEWDDTIANKDSINSTNIIPPKEYLLLNDSVYPYAGIPRIVIETENNQEIKDREMEIPAKLQIWGEKAPESEVMDLTIRGRGNSSWTEMPQKSYKIEFINKQALLSMPKDKDWALIANYADKTLMKNYLMYHLSAKLGSYYAPKCEFVELYLNKKYFGVYLLTETIKIGKNRINIPKNDSSYIVEMDMRLEEDEQAVFSHILRDDSLEYNWHFHFEIHSPKKASQQSLKTIEELIQTFETYLANIRNDKDNHIDQWLDISDYEKHYWIQEFSKNPNAAGISSVYFSWIKGNSIKMGPVWDFDLAFGSYRDDSINSPENWYIKKTYWDFYILRDSIANQKHIDFWKENKDVLAGTIDTADSIYVLLQAAAANNFKKWKILKNTQLVYHHHAYATYKDAVEDLKDWIRKRITWIDTHI